MTADPAWEVVGEFANHLAAEIVASVLRVESIPVRIVSSGALPGLELGSRVLVPADQLHRARWLCEQAQVSDAELELLATGRLPLRR
jgi:hypothetical protein